jgi:hypothetical protein
MEIKVALGEIRRGLGRPHEAELSDSDILMELWQVLVYYRSILNLTHESWSVKRWDFFVNPGSISEKKITVGDFGSAIFVTSKDDVNPYFIKRTIEVVGPEQMSLHYSGPTNLLIGGTWWSPHVAAVFSVFNENGIWKISWLPAHSSSAEYTMWYVAGVTTTPPLYDGSTGYPIEESNWLIVANCIVNLFPHLADEETGLNPKQQTLLQSAQAKVAQYSPVLEARRWDGLHREPTQRRKIFGQRRENR